jgi:hypothetical protein
MGKPNTIDRTRKLNKLIEIKQRHLTKAPKGHLKIRPIRGKDRYYQVIAGATSQVIYLNQKKLDLARQLAQKSYDLKVLKAAELELQAWNLLASHFPDTTVEEVYATLSPARQKLVTPIIPTDDQYREQWESVTYTPGYFKPDAPVYITDRGERVRSKSEQLIANLLYRLGIPYRYEYPIEVVVNGHKRTWRPDFTILDIKNRRELYLEHFGMLDDPNDTDNYARNAFGKMKIYEENGMHEGNCMLYSFETSRAPLDIAYVEMKVRRALEL